jgi:hypothetical protein
MKTLMKINILLASEFIIVIGGHNDMIFIEQQRRSKFTDDKSW